LCVAGSHHFITLGIIFRETWIPRNSASLCHSQA